MKARVALLLALLSCGDEDTGATRLVDLEDPEVVALCEYANAALPAAVVECMVDGTPVPVDPSLVRDDGCDDATAADIPPTCPATVADFKACADAYGADVCALVRGEAISACAVVESAACTGE